MVNEDNQKRAVRSRTVKAVALGMSALGLGVLGTGLIYDVYGLKSAQDYYQNMADASVMAVLDTAHDDAARLPLGHNIHLNTKGKHNFSTEILIDKDRQIQAQVVGYFTSPLRTWFGTKWVGNGRVKIVRTAMGQWPENYAQSILNNETSFLGRPARLAGGAP